MTTSAPRATGRPRVGRAAPTTATRNRRFSYLLIAATVVALPAWLLTRTEPRLATQLEFTASPQPYAVPPGICRLRVDLIGGAGGRGATMGTPGAGVEAVAFITVTPEETLHVYVGGWGGDAVGPTPGSGGWNGGGEGGKAFGNEDGPGKAGGGGGGATDIRRGGVGLEHRIVVAAGGAGAAGGGIGGTLGTGGGSGGGLSGDDGFAALGTANPATGGGGGSQTTGGNAGRNTPDLAAAATAGMLGAGGDGASGGTSGGGGGGGGLYGGGGGGGSRSFSGGHGGGGSGIGPERTAFRSGVGGGDGRARISFDPDHDSCAVPARRGSKR